MPIYDYKCEQCGAVTEKIRPSSVTVIVCPMCLADDAIVNEKIGPGAAHRMLSVPAGFRFPDMLSLNRKRQRIKEPVYRFPDGHVESVH